MLNTLLLLFGQSQAATPSPEGEPSSWSEILINEWAPRGLTIVIVLAVLILPFVIGRFLAKTARMPDYATRLGVILLAIAASVAILLSMELRYGVDLKGGVILIYQLEAEELQDESAEQPSARDLVQPLSRRINPSGTKEIVVRPYGEHQIEIIVPDVDPVAIDVLKKTIVTAGKLEFRIVADSIRHADIIEAAEVQSESPVASERQSKLVMMDDELVAQWVTVARDTEPTNGIYKFKTGVSSDVIRNPATGEILENLPVDWDPDSLEFEKYLEEQGVDELEVLMAWNDGYDVTGSHLSSVRTDFDSTMNYAVAFTMNSAGAARMGGLTRTYGPDEGRRYRLGIVLDNELISAPSIQSTISDRGQITGNFSQEEVEFLVSVLRAGRLPAVLQKQPISENQIDPTLGLDTIKKGMWAIGISLGTVLVFISIYYQFSGIVACSALLLNLLLIFAMMKLLQAPLTLPGLAGLVLTVGMSVDANVLIFERIREELDRGSALRMAIRNGFSRATTTIVDANITTLITAIVLYAIGTDQVRGFAVTLILGILMSMFTAIYCSRVVFDFAERLRWISKLAMWRLVGATHIDFMGKRMLGALCSILLIAVGLTAVVVRGVGIFDIDFRGGTSATMVLKEPLTDAEVRARLDETLGQMRDEGSMVDYSVARVDMEGLEAWKVDSSLPEVETLQDALRSAFTLASYELDIEELSEEVIQVPARSATNSENGSTTPDSPPPTDGAGAEPKDADRLNVSLVAQRTLAAAAANNQEAPADDAPMEPGEDPEPEEDPAAAAEPVGAEENGRTVRRTSSKIHFVHAMNAPTLRAKLKESLEEALGSRYTEVDIVVRPDADPEQLQGWTPKAAAKYQDWNIDIALSQTQAEQVLEHFKQDLESTPVWQSSSVIGGKVAGDTQSLAIAALLASLLGIIAYIWIRFQRVVYGLAAVVALVHDVLITLGAIAISFWLARFLPFLLIEEFKISLPVVAAFLTIIGYSLNDTIVVFDRIREVRGKSPKLTSDMINVSLNQTLGRTLLTSMTTLLVVLVLYFIGGQGIHGFAFSLVVGVLVGTYSSMFVASPVLLWMSGDKQSPATG